MPVIVKELRDAGLSTQDALEIWQQGFSYIDEDMRPADHGEDVEEPCPVYPRENPSAQAPAGLRQGRKQHGFFAPGDSPELHNPEFAQEQKREASAATQQAKREIQKQ